MDQYGLCVQLQETKVVQQITNEQVQEFNYDLEMVADQIGITTQQPLSALDAQNNSDLDHQSRSRDDIAVE